MNNKGNNNIPTSVIDDGLLTTAAKNACDAIREKYLCSIPDTWNFECGTKKLTFKDIKEQMINEGISVYTEAELNSLIEDFTSLVSSFSFFSLKSQNLQAFVQEQNTLHVHTMQVHTAAN